MIITLIERLLIKFNQLESRLLRLLYYRRYDVKIGMYSYGCFDNSRVPRGTRIGRYCSIAYTAYIFAKNHSLDYISLHPYFYNPSVALVEVPFRGSTQCRVEDDVWIGHNAIITPNVNFVGRGSVIGAGSVVTKNVPRYAIVAGNPAKIIRYRFSPETILLIEASQWWLMTKEQLKVFISSNPGFAFDPKTSFSP